MSDYNKPYLTFEQQLDLLKSRQLEVTNDNAAKDYLRRLGYYRLSGYWYPCRKLNSTNAQDKLSRPKRLDQFKKNARFQDIISLYIFDKKLRLIVLDAVERIEVAVRVDVAYLLGDKDPFAYNNPLLLHGNFTKKINPATGITRYEEWLKKHDNLIKRSKEEFASHFRDKYGLPIPIWVAIELWDFGLLSTFYQGMTVRDKDIIAKKYSIVDWQVFESWLRTLNYARNVVAHHNRLWNRNLIDQPKLAKVGDMPMFDHLIGNVHMTSRIYVVMCILAHFIKHICPRSSWSKRVVELLDSFPITEHFKISDMGFPENWKSQNLWRS